jgi:hypothetical protein
MAQDPITAVANLIDTLAEKFFADKDSQLKGEINIFVETVKAKMNVLMTEMQGNTLQRTWRPILMLSIVGIIVNNYLLYPYLSLFGVENVIPLELPNHLWGLLKIGVGGYVVGRSAEKVAKTWKKGDGLDINV